MAVGGRGIGKVLGLELSKIGANVAIPPPNSGCVGLFVSSLFDHTRTGEGRKKTVIGRASPLGKELFKTL